MSEILCRWLNQELQLSKAVGKCDYSYSLAYLLTVSLTSYYANSNVTSVFVSFLLPLAM